MSTPLRSFDQLLTWLPHELGFVPDASVVLIALDQEEIIGLLRLPDQTPGLHPGEVPTSLHRTITDLMAPLAPTSFVLIEYRADSGDLDLTSLGTWLGKEIAPVAHVLVVVGEVWWATECDPGCCDGALHSLSETSGLPRAGQRSWPTDTVLTAVLTETAPDPRALDASACFDAWTTIMAHPPTTATPELGVAVSAYWRPELRDVFLTCVVPEMAGGALASGAPPALRALDQERRDALAGEALTALPELMPLIPEPVRPYWLALLCLARWRAGDLDGARHAGRQAIEEGPTVALAELAWSAARSHMPPTRGGSPRQEHPRAATVSPRDAHDVDHRSAGLAAGRMRFVS